MTRHCPEKYFYPCNADKSEQVTEQNGIFSNRLLRVGHALMEALEPHEIIRAPLNSGRLASVLMPLWDDGDDIQVVFTKRSSDLPTHAGQVSFPGGMAETSDSGLSCTALRETQEEIGVPPEKVAVLRRLDQLKTITGFVVTPYLGLLASDISFRVNKVEVDHLLMVPLKKVLDREAYHEVLVDWDGMKLSQMGLAHDKDIIWGATFRMLQNFIERLDGRLEDILSAAYGQELQKGVDRVGGVV